MSDVAKATVCPCCNGVGQTVESCMEYAPYPGTTWEMIHDSSSGSSWCYQCGKNYNAHGAPSDIAAQLGVPETMRHLLCPRPAGPCARELGHDGDHMDERRRSYSSVVRARPFQPPEIKHPLYRVHPEGSGAVGALTPGGTVLTPVTPPAHLQAAATPKARGDST